MDTEDHTTYRKVLQKGINKLADDYKSGAREMTMDALLLMRILVEPAAYLASYDKDKTLDLLVQAAIMLSPARPPMYDAISTSLLHFLHEVSELWEKAGNTLHLGHAKRAKAILARMRSNLKHCIVTLGKAFVRRIDRLVEETSAMSINILTLSSSSTVRAALSYLISESYRRYSSREQGLLGDDPKPKIPLLNINVMESRPLCEGADLVQGIMQDANNAGYLTKEHPVHFTITPDCAVGTVINEGVDLILLGADKVSSEGDVMNKTGSLAAVCCARVLKPEVPIWVLVDTSKITGSSTDVPPPSEHLSTFRVLSGAWKETTRDHFAYINVFPGRGDFLSYYSQWFEMVPAVACGKSMEYITEEGLLGLEDIQERRKLVQGWRKEFGLHNLFY